MNSEEYENLAHVELHHWYYQGKRQIVVHWLKKMRALAPGRLLVDCGGGTGTFAREVGRFCNALLIDDHDESLSLAMEKLGPHRVKKGSCTQIPLANQQADSITALDVLEHVEDDRQAVLEFARILKPGGVLVVTVPACQALWSDWDVCLHHHRRYSKNSLQALLQHENLEVIHLNYINVVAFPAILLLRKISALRNKTSAASARRMEDRIPPAWLNWTLRQAFVLPACQTLLHFPIGVGLLAVVRRR